MTKPLADVQRIVLRSNPWAESRHLVFSFPKEVSRLHLLKTLKPTLWPTAAAVQKCAMQVSLGFSRRGLAHAGVPRHVLTAFALKSPAFVAGAALRASSQLGATGCDAPASWDDAFEFTALDAVLSLHAMAAGPLGRAVDQVKAAAAACRVKVTELAPARRLETPPGQRPDPQAQWVHFGYRDGLARVGIEGWTAPEKLYECKPASRFPAGEFVLGHAQQSGANPWLAGPGLRVWPKELRSFFANGSFGVLHQVEQHVAAFQKFVDGTAEALHLDPDEIKAKLCGRYPDGRPLAADRGAPLKADFDYTHDRHGYDCPFGSHVRRMNPRGDSLAHDARARPLLRRGMPYGPAWKKAEEDDEKRGLFGHFFCASIEDQFEHLVGQWADRVPLGSKDVGGARDPLMGAHAPGDGDFVIPRPPSCGPLRLTGLEPFTRTRGTAYLFYPSLQALAGIADHSVWGMAEEDEEEAEDGA